MEPESHGRFRDVQGWAAVYAKVLAVATVALGITFVLNLPLYFARISLFNQQYLALLLGLILALAYVLVPATPRSRRAVPWYDWLFSLASLAIGLYVFIQFPIISLTMGLITPLKVWISALGIVLLLEATRRSAGWSLVAVVLLFILYARFGSLLPSDLAPQPIRTDRLLMQLFLGSGSVLGIALRVVALVVFAYVLLANVLIAVGGAEVLFQLSQALLGRYRGGPAKISIVASSLFGTLSGSAVANVVSTGTVTIPLMKRSGYSPSFAAAVEAVASTGGVIAPPVMGAASFIIADFVQVPYGQVLLVAIIPALFYYAGLFAIVDARAARLGLVGLPPEELPRLSDVLRRGWLFGVPLAVLIYALLVLYVRAEVAALYALVTLIAVALLNRDMRQRLKNMGRIIDDTARGLIDLIVISATAGMVVEIVSYTGLGLTMSRLLTEAAGGNLILLALLTAVASIILGMGMPVTAAYLLLAVLAAPAMVRTGVPPLVAHMFVFYFGTFSFITPPVAVASFAAAAIAGAPVMKTSFEAVRLAVPGLVVPFAFILEPALVFHGSFIDFVIAFVITVIAVAAVVVSLEGQAARPLVVWERAVYGLGGLALLFPALPAGKAIGLGVLVLVTLWVALSGRGSRAAHAPGRVRG